MILDDDKIKILPVKFSKPAPDERTLLHPHEVQSSKCMHYPGHFIIDASLAEVTCADCKEKLNPMWVLQQLAGRDRRFAEAHETYAKQMKRLSERERTKCDHCGKLTRISRG